VILALLGGGVSLHVMLGPGPVFGTVQLLSVKNEAVV
jgi:hypothetical protein